MTSNELAGFYEKKKSELDKAVKSATAKIDRVANFRLAVAALFLVLLYCGFTYDTVLLYGLLPVLAVFIVLVRRHAALFDERVHLENLREIQKKELFTLAGDYSHNNSGAEFIDVHHPYTHDLDIFGEGSLFQYINRAWTRGGKALLAARFAGATETREEIEARQSAVRELAGKSAFRHEVQALTMQVDEQRDDQRQLTEWLTQRPFVYGRRGYRFILIAFPVITVSLVIASFLVDGITRFAILAAGLQWIFLGFHLKRVNAFHDYIGRKAGMLTQYARILSCIGQEGFESPLMQSLSARAKEAERQMQKLASLTRTFDARMNSMMNLLVNSLLMFDLQCVYRLERWKEQHAAALPAWLETIREAEALCSLGTFSFNHPGFAFPRVRADLVLRATDMGHPLLMDDERVVNDIQLDADHSIMLITGANMAGKSTFLRSLGVNIVLSLAGAPVCAREFQCPLVGLRSGMRTADSLKEHHSYFYAELDRLKSIMDELREGKPLLILLDEILKGTNSSDKQAGSVALVKQLTGYNCLALIATHDLALGDLENSYPDKVRNYSFEATIEDEQLSFDYKLKPGLAQTMNATFLMRKMGIITGD